MLKSSQQMTNQTLLFKVETAQLLLSIFKMSLMQKNSISFNIWIINLVIFLWMILAGNAPAAPDFSTVKPGQVFRDCPDCPEMVVIPAGKFLMGMSNKEIQHDKEEGSLFLRLLNRYASTALPQHVVTIGQSLALAKYPVTTGEYATFVKETGFSTDQPCVVHVRNRFLSSSSANWQHPGFDQSDHDPVVCVSWKGAQAYIAWLNIKVNGLTPKGKIGPYRLPSEAEWEYIARAGTQTVRWWGDDIGSNKAVCVGCFSPWDNQQPAPVGLYGHNTFGIFDMLGNTWEWTEDCWNKNYLQAPQDGNSWLTGSCDERVMRGGSWVSDISAVTSAFRSKIDLRSYSNSVGFRLAKTL